MLRRPALQARPAAAGLPFTPAQLGYLRSLNPRDRWLVDGRYRFGLTDEELAERAAGDLGWDITADVVGERLDAAVLVARTLFR